MEIVSMPPGNVWSHTFTCKKCRAKLKASQHDVRLDATDPREPPWCYLVCPCCQEKHTIKRPACV